jgi:hypothetical protein
MMTPTTATENSQSSLTAHYAPSEERPLRSYAILSGTYGTAFAGSLVALRARGHELPERITAGDVLLIGVATHKLSRLIAKDKVTSFPTSAVHQISGVERTRRGRRGAVWSRCPPRCRRALGVPLLPCSVGGYGVHSGAHRRSSSHAAAQRGLRRTHGLRLPADRLPRRGGRATPCSFAIERSG